MLLRLSQYQKNILALTSSHMLAEPSQLKKNLLRYRPEAGGTLL